MNEPNAIQLRAIDVKPHHYGIWCSFGDGEPFVNPIVLRSWCQDGHRISFMMDSHVFLNKEWDEIIDVIPYGMGYSEELLAKCDAEDEENMKRRPTQAPDWLKPFPTLIRYWYATNEDQLDYQKEIMQLGEIKT